MVQGLEALVAHEAHCALVEHLVQYHKTSIPVGCICSAKVGLQVALQNAPLLHLVRKVDEEKGTHVLL